jgi:hypothetical protein
MLPAAQAGTSNSSMRTKGKWVSFKWALSADDTPLPGRMRRSFGVVRAAVMAATSSAQIKGSNPWICPSRARNAAGGTVPAGAISGHALLSSEQVNRKQSHPYRNRRNGNH